MTRTSVPEIITLNHDSGSRLQIIPALGGSLFSLVLRSGKNRAYVIPVPPLFNFNSFYKNSFWGAKLLPYPNRLKDSSYGVGNQRFHIHNESSSSKDSIHGLIYDKAFEIINQCNAKIKLRYISNSIAPGYPFGLEVTLEYILGENNLSVITSVKNISNSTIPIGDGWHPYFSLGEDLDAWHLKMDACSMIETDRDLIPTGKLNPVHNFKDFGSLSNVKLDNCFKFSDRGVHTIELINKEKKQHLFIKMGDPYSYCQIYIPADRKTIAIEAQTCPANAFNNGMGLIKLVPEETLNTKFEIVLQQY